MNAHVDAKRATYASSELDRLLRRASPYEGYTPDPELIGLRWPTGSADNVLADIIRDRRPETILEVGSFEGASAIFMGHTARHADLQTRIVCIDTWLGSPEHLILSDFDEILKVKNGLPRLYFRFLGNVLQAGLSDIITPLANTSENAATILSIIGIKAGLAFIDAAHEYEPALKDFKAYWSLLDEDGILVGDDYDPTWEGVVRAAQDFARSVQKPLYVKRGKFILQKGLPLPDRLLIANGFSRID